MTTPQKAKHSPLPWHIKLGVAPIADTGNYDDIVEIQNSDREVVCFQFNPSDKEIEDFKFMCLASNNHDALVEALKKAKRQIIIPELYLEIESLLSKIEAES